MATLTREETRRLGKLRHRLGQEAKDLELAGLEERASRVRAEQEQVDAKLEAAKRAAQAAEERRWAEKRRQKEAHAARERAEEQAEQEARAFLESLFASGQPVEVGVVFDAAKEAGVESHHLLAAAGALGLRSLGWLKSGTGTLIDRTRGRYWGPPQGAGMLDAGPPSLPAA